MYKLFTSLASVALHVEEQKYYNPKKYPPIYLAFLWLFCRYNSV